MNKTITKLLLFLLAFNALTPCFSQKKRSRAALEIEKRKNLQKIIQVKKILKQTTFEKQNTVNKVKILKQQIENQKNRIRLAIEDHELTNNEIIALRDLQKSKANEIKKIQKEFEQTIYNAAKRSNQLSKLGYLFSSKSLNELFRRYKYLEQYAEKKNKQIAKIQKLNEQYKLQQKTLIAKRNSQNKSIEDLKVQVKHLDILRKNEGLIVAELSKKEKELKLEIEKTKEAVSSLNKLISNAISKNKEINNTALNNTTSNDNSDFAHLKSKMIWPASGLISDHFGVKNHPVLKGIKIINNGVDIQTDDQASVHAVFGGKILDISDIPGLNRVVAIQHGSYYTVYANLENVQVSINDVIDMNQKIGNAAKKDGVSELNFQIWHNFDKLNPEVWLMPK